MPDGEKINPNTFVNLVYDFWQRDLFAVTDHSSVDAQARVHRLQLDPGIWRTPRALMKSLFEDDSAIFLEFRIGLRYAPGT